MDRISKLIDDWKRNPRWQYIKRNFTAEDVIKLRGSYDLQYSFATLGAEHFWHLLSTEEFVGALGALTGNQAVQQVLHDVLMF